MVKCCGNCSYARQRGNKDDQNIVGCCNTYYNDDSESFYTVSETSWEIPVTFLGEGNIYKGWYYNCRMVGDVDDNSTLGKGAMTNGVLVDNTQCCNNWSDYE